MYKLILAVILAPVFNVSCGGPSSGNPATSTTPTFRVAAGSAPGSVEIADVNGDGKPDLVVANEQSNDVTVLLGDGKGAFSQAKGCPFPAGHDPNDIAVGDFNRDGKLDLAFANHEEKFLTVLLGDGRGAFTPAQKSPFAVEVKPHTHGVAAGDLNFDGNLDLVTDSWGTDQVEVLFGDGKGGFTIPGSFFAVGKHPYQRVRVADVNGDGRADVITTNLEGDNVTVLLSDGRGGLNPSPGSPFGCGDSPFNFAIGDVNADGKLDIAIVNSPSSTSDRQGKDGLTVLLGDGTGRFAMMAGSPFATGRIPNIAAVGDLNGDGIGDIAVSSPDGDNVTVFIMGRKGMISSYTITVGGHPKGLAIRDLNGDGKEDLVVTNNAENAVTVMLSK